MPKYEEPNPEEENAEPERPLDAFFYHQRRALEETARALESLLPPGFKEHSTEAGKEFAKGFKVLVDAAMEELRRVSERSSEEVEEGDAPPSTTGNNKVKVDVE